MPYEMVGSKANENIRFDLFKRMNRSAYYFYYTIERCENLCIFQKIDVTVQSQSQNSKKQNRNCLSL